MLGAALGMNGIVPPPPPFMDSKGGHTTMPTPTPFPPPEPIQEFLTNQRAGIRIELPACDNPAQLRHAIPQSLIITLLFPVQIVQVTGEEFRNPHVTAHNVA
jgi:hypothetical protein